MAVGHQGATIRLVELDDAAEDQMLDQRDDLFHTVLAPTPMDRLDFERQIKAARTVLQYWVERNLLWHGKRGSH